MSDINDILAAAAEGNAVELKTHISDVLKSRLTDKIVDRYAAVEKDVLGDNEDADNEDA